MIIRWKKWSRQLRALFAKEVEANRLASNKRYDSRDKSKPFKADLIVYFLGNQVEDSPMDLEVTDYRKIAIIVEPNGLYKDYPNHSFLQKTPPVAETSEPPSWVTSEFDAPPPEPRKPDPPIAPRPQPTPEQQSARATAAARGSAPVVTDHYRRVGGPAPTYYPPEPEPRTGFLEWLKSLRSALTLRDRLLSDDGRVARSRNASLLALTQCAVCQRF